jgi:hypothetical protein
MAIVNKERLGVLSFLGCLGEKSKSHCTTMADYNFPGARRPILTAGTAGDFSRSSRQCF